MTNSIANKSNTESINDKERDEQEYNIRRALAIVKLESQTPGPNAQAVLDKYRNGNITHNKLEMLLREAALKDLTDNHNSISNAFDEK